MTNVFDIATYILSKQGGPMPAMKLHKLVYYCQAWSLVWDEEPLFNEPIKAWANGPVVPELYEVHKGKFKVEAADFQGNTKALNETQKEIVSIVLRDYGSKPSQWLSDLTHMEAPWRETRKGLSNAERGDREITWATMAEYYESLLPEED
ncbi:prophage ps3 protein 01 [Candidatus Thiomargarita nelsonii]|uniref:Prophage ps3 protein 01 n=1 Tax=Candidatus Thiomargarita nelsonii TaxID=1003181 RepID=A0A0A6P428_9GAMM|nr:prophage ps3 protein 01 [Candidatus Thiomargarita nelsonii]